MRSYVLVVLIIVGMVGAYIALLPLTVSSEVNANFSVAAPG